MEDVLELVLDRTRSLDAASVVGAKGATLARLIDAGIPVPDFFVVSSRAFACHLRQNRLAWPPSESDSPETLRAQISEAPVPEPVARAVDSALGGLMLAGRPSPLAVRSSAAEEDSAQSSFAGQFISLLAVDPQEVLEAVKKIWASYLSDRSISYRLRRGIPFTGDPGFAVIVQTQVFPRVAGVLFTIHPLAPEGETAYLEANFGTGESVAGSLATPDGFTISRSTGAVVDRRIGTKRRMTVVDPGAWGSRVVDVKESMRDEPAITGSEAEEVFRAGKAIEHLLGHPQDVEWAFEGEKLWILQARPVTGMARSQE
jgi:phosphoenolpyruvate synthase/pyruvate phosphate dikinase